MKKLKSSVRIVHLPVSADVNAALPSSVKAVKTPASLDESHPPNTSNPNDSNFHRLINFHLRTKLITIVGFVDIPIRFRSSENGISRKRGGPLVPVFVLTARKQVNNQIMLLRSQAHLKFLTNCLIPTTKILCSLHSTLNRRTEEIWARNL